MGVLTRLVGPLEGETKLPVHQFMAALAEYKRGAITGAQVAEAFVLDSDEENDLQTFLDGMDGTLTREKVHDVLMLGERKLYTLAKVQTELGLT